MSVSFENYLVVGISSRALFNLEKENEVFEKEGLDAYRDYQIVHENDVLSPGSGFALVKNLLNINKLANRKLVEVIVMSRNSADTSLRIIHSLEHYDMDIGRMVLSGGEDISRYLSAFGVDLFLSCNENDVSNAIHAGFAAGMIYARDTKYSFPDNQIRIAFDADAVLFSAESEKIYQEHGLEAFNENEILNQDVALQKGPMASLLKSLSWLQNETKDLNVLIKVIQEKLKYRNEEFQINEPEALRLVLERFIPDFEDIKNEIEGYDKTLIDYYKQNEVSFSRGNRVNFNEDKQTVVKNLRERVYKTRNSIVHSKETDKMKYLPFKHDKELLKEIILMRVIAEKIIIGSSEEL